MWLVSYLVGLFCFFVVDGFIFIFGVCNLVVVTVVVGTGGDDGGGVVAGTAVARGGFCFHCCSQPNLEPEGLCEKLC